MVDVRLLLDTGPTAAEVERIRATFRAWDLDAAVEGHSYGGPPPTSAFLIVVNTQLPVLLSRLTDTGLDKLVTSLLSLRADPGQWGKSHVVKLEDAHSGLGVVCHAAVPSHAYAALLALDLSAFDRDSPPLQMEWNPALDIWQARLLDLAERATVRIPRLPAGQDGPRLRRLDEAEMTELWRLVTHGSVITKRRAKIILAGAVGWNIDSIARRVVVSREHVSAVVSDFNAVGLAALAPGFEGRQVTLAGRELDDALAVARRRPSEFGLPGSRWRPAVLAEFLVTEGLVEDITPGGAEELIHGTR